MGDVGILGIAGPGDILFSTRERGAYGMQALHKVSGLGNLVINLGSHAGHGAHVGDNIRTVRNLDAVLGDWRTDGTHAERNNVHGAALHASLEEAVQLGLHDGRLAPVIGRTGIFLRLAADKSTLLDAGDVTGITAYKKGVGALVGIQPETCSRLHDAIAHELILRLGAVAPEDGIGLSQVGDLLHPISHLGDGR